MKLLTVFLLIISSSACMAQPSNVTSSTGDVDCSVISISPQLDACVHKQMLNSNVQLLTEMKNFENRSNELYKPDPKLGKALIETVREAQDAWLKFREKNCKMEAFEIQKGTSAYITTVNNCIVRMNEERINILKKLLQ